MFYSFFHVYYAVEHCLQSAEELHYTIRSCLAIYLDFSTTAAEPEEPCVSNSTEECARHLKVWAPKTGKHNQVLRTDQVFPTYITLHK
jgi:hypothetical protein